MGSAHDAYPPPIVPQMVPGNPNTELKEVSAEQAAREESLTKEVMAAFDNTPSPRLKQLTQVKNFC